MEFPTLSFTPASLGPRDAYRLLISVLVPRPIAWVASQGADGSVNLAPFSFFGGVGNYPPTIMVAIGQRQGRPKDTLRNIQETGEFVVHIVDETLAPAMNVTSGEYAYEVNEFELAHLATVPSLEVRPPRLAAAPVALECKVSQLVPVDGTTYTMVLGRVLHFHVREGLLRPNGLVDADLLRPVARLGGDEYATLGAVFEMQRPPA
ncbi:flavin reductase family protein [Candidatus Amarolinea aalborgensis]|jgi:flavin reductase (DIM6/NTAB) family NADH-FMN oxidoreductase RutF|uniref:flavin reductase family protein n=1 Tax=Candidatus Amarolinea aalborgensis TaxID=2249329 RepID=UPI003BFA1896